MKNLGWKIISIILLPIQFIVFKIITSNEEWVEYYYSRGFFKIITHFLRIITGWTSFSIGLILVYILSAFLVYLIIKSIFRIRKKEVSLRQIATNFFAYLSPVYLFFMLTWGLAYHKKPLEKLLNLNTKNIQNQEVISLCKVLIDSANVTRARISESKLKEQTFEKIFELAPIGYANLEARYTFLNYTTPSIKKAEGSNLLAYMSTSGVYMFPTGEANVNTNNMIYDVPYVTTHEMAHQLGFASEEEANYLAYLSCKNNPDPVFQYSAYYGTVFRALNKVWEIDSTYSKTLFDKLSPAVKADREKERQVWKKFRNPIQVYVVSPFYDLFLKSNGQEQGSRSYDLVIDLMVAERRKGLKK
ncbi:DUF3810 domain-containing protein [Lacihabitans sp. CCS-44]|uniref:DUF3810 domain-containing protein n=1 Tax=Lacihabitans sp. CCS-44 TaxID=2487331 RepID=UPI0020CFDC70|nr:DUF3810 domain-containing protein [Lacihabitans sp. CCS-44]MCP9756594.1 DUF3810 domain-containing protein [Lacihabitans sp. CCS-44]